MSTAAALPPRRRRHRDGRYANEPSTEPNLRLAQPPAGPPSVDGTPAEPPAWVDEQPPQEVAERHHGTPLPIDNEDASDACDVGEEEDSYGYSRVVCRVHDGAHPGCQMATPREPS